jgi:hypothetical protein
MSGDELFQVFGTMRDGAHGYRGVSQGQGQTAADNMADVRVTGDVSWQSGDFDMYHGAALQQSNSMNNLSESLAQRAAAVDQCTDAGEACSAQSTAIAQSLYA